MLMKSMKYLLSARVISYSSRIVPGTFKLQVEFTILYE